MIQCLHKQSDKLYFWVGIWNTGWMGKQKKAYKFLRDDIEKIIKEEKIDRSRFQEFSKIKFHEIIKNFYYAF